jgi:hypothetical protein
MHRIFGRIPDTENNRISRQIEEITQELIKFPKMSSELEFTVVCLQILVWI